MTAPTSTQIPGYVVGTWDIDPVHSDVSFTVRHMMVSKVRGRLGTFSGEIVTAPQFSDTTVTVTLLESTFEQESEPLLTDGGYGAVVEDRPMTRRCADSTCDAVVNVRDGDLLGLKVVKAGEDVNVLGQTTQGLALKALERLPK